MIDGIAVDPGTRAATPLLGHPPSTVNGFTRLILNMVTSAFRIQRVISRCSQQSTQKLAITVPLLSYL